jgi:hypothetical protein
LGLFLQPRFSQQVSKGDVMSLKFKFAAPFLFMLLGALTLPAFGQAGGGGGGGGGNGGGGGGGGRGNFNPQQFQQQQMDRLKTALGATDDEFAALQPKIEKVQTLQRSLQTGGRGGFGGGGAGGRRGNNGGGAAGGGAAATPAAPANPVAAAAADLQTTLADTNAKPEDIKTKLDALRSAKKAAKEDLTKAQEDLKGVLTQRQEAVLVEFGMLD